MDKQENFGWGWDRDTRSNRMKTICEILDRQPGLTMRMIATRLGLRKTPYVRNMIIDLMEDHRVHYDWTAMTNGARCMVFFPGPAEPMLDDLSVYDNLQAERLSASADAESGFPYVVIDEEIQHQLEDHPDWPLPND